METNKNTYLRFGDTIEPITRIDFSIYSNKNILDDSVIVDDNGELSVPGIHIAEINTNVTNGEPIRDGVADRRLGTVENDREFACTTCNETGLKCPGHFGHIQLVEPVFHLGYISFLKDILSCICIRCHKLLVYKNEKEISKLLQNEQGKQRFLKIRAICKSITHCQKENYGCGTPAHKISIDKKGGELNLMAVPFKKNSDDSKEKKREPQIITPKFCYNLLRSISDEDCMILGFDPKKSRPQDMIIVNFPVPPIQVRPSIKMDIGASSTKDDDLTHKLIDIVKSNENLKNSKGDGSLLKSTVVNYDFMLLQLHVATFFNNESMSLPRSLQKNKKETKSISQRLNKKEGRVRGNLMGKRVDQSGRDVITSGAELALDEIGIPLMIAMNLTFPEIVTENNKKYLEKLVQNGSKIYPGANTVIKNTIDDLGNESKSIYKLKYAEILPKLELGDMVERHLIDGDIVLFNRQPSLHKMSMMSHKCKIITNKNFITFRVNVNVTDPYNADFDGDEMNIHIPQTVQTATELRLISNVASRFVNPSSGNIAFNVKQDSLMGIYQLTMNDIWIDWKDAMNILMNTSVRLNGNIPKGTLVSGKYLYSQIIQNKINMVKKNDDGQVVTKVVNGNINLGTFTKSEIQNIVQQTWSRYSGKESVNFIDDTQRIALQFLLRYGFTIGIKDTIVPKQVHQSIATIIETARKEALTTITKYENDPYAISKFAHELSLTRTLQAVADKIQKTIKNDFTNSSAIYITVTSGSSGGDMNIGQIIGCIGQVIVEGSRIKKKFNNRTLPMFYQHDDSALGRGFCYNSFMKGLNPSEFFFQVMSGREGLISTAIKTAETGYIQRKLVKILEDIKVEYDGTVRNANNKLIQCIYGDNGIHIEKQFQQKIDIINKNNNDIRKNYVYAAEEIKDLKSDKYTLEINEKLYGKLIVMRDNLRSIQNQIMLTSTAIKEMYMLPFDLSQVINSIVNAENRNNKKVVDPYYVLSCIHKFYTGTDCKVMKYNNDTSVIKKDDEKHLKMLLKTYIYDMLAPKKCTHQHRFSTEEFDSIIDYCRDRMKLSQVEGGEMVGVVGAQSVGEPVTQATLKAFQQAGTGKGGVSGLHRVKELLSISKNLKAPTIKIIVDQKYSEDRATVDKIASHLKYTTIQDVINRVDIVYDPDPNDKKNSATYNDQVTNIFEGGKGKNGCQTEISGLPWVLRLVLSKEKMINRNLTMLEIKTSFCQNWANRFEDSKGNKKEYKKTIEKITQCAIVTNFDNSDVPIVHIRFNANKYNFNTFIQFQEMIINKYRIKGLPNITESNNVEKEDYITYDQEGTQVKKSRFVINTEGINLKDITHINGINLSETFCNDIVLINKIYGIEAARAAFIREFNIIIDKCSYQHIELLADAITHMGGLISVNRHGANKLDTDPFSRASFEKTVEQLLAAAAFGETDHIRSVSSKIMVGSLVNGGTGCFDLLLDHDLVKKLPPPKTKEEPTLKKKSLIKSLIKK